MNETSAHHEHEAPKPSCSCADKKSRGSHILTVRAHSGLSGDMFLAGLLRMADIDEKETDALLSAILPQLSGSVRLVRRHVHHIGGWHAEISLPHEHEHRTLRDILTIISQSAMSEPAKQFAVDTFTLLAKAESTVHGKTPEEIHFHEVGALDSILDICMSCELFARLAPSRFVVSPLPIADGAAHCAHGIIPVPAPAVLELLEGVPVRPFPGEGETVTPTAIALLHGFKATYGPWPCMQMQKQALVYGTRIFTDAPNGAVFAYGAEQAAF